MSQPQQTRPGVTTRARSPGRRARADLVTTTEVVGGYTFPAPSATLSPVALQKTENYTIGDALESVASTIGNKPVDQSDAAAIKVAEARATGTTTTIPGNIGSAAQAAADANAVAIRESDKTTIGSVLRNACARLASDKVVSRVDAERVVEAEMRNNPSGTTNPNGVAASMVAAARLNKVGVP